MAKKLKKQRDLTTRLTNRPIECFKHWRDDGSLLLDTPYQRGDVWGVKRQVNFIKSIVIGVPIPALVINDRLSAGWESGDTTLAMIDGKQRCTAILDFLDGKLRVPGSLFGVAKRSIAFSELSRPQQLRFKQQAIPVHEGQLTSLEDEIEVFNLINFSGLAQGESDFESKGCQCIELSKDKLAEAGVEVVQHLQINLETGKSQMSGPSILVRKANGYKGRLRTLFCSYCPFCGKQLKKGD